MTPRKEINPPVGPDVQRVLTAMSAECASERERALRWEALARQLGAALELSDPAHMGEKREQWLAALSVYRDAIKEDTET